MTALLKGCLASGPHSWVLTTSTEPLARFSPGKPFFNKAKSRYTLPVRIPADAELEVEISARHKLPVRIPAEI